MNGVSASFVLSAVGVLPVILTLDFNDSESAM